MSKFFVRTSDSETDSSSEDERPSVVSKTKRIANFVFDETESKRIVKTSADKQKEELNVIIHQIKNLIKIRDVSNLFNSFGELIRVFEKYESQKECKPVVFYQCLEDVDCFIAEIWEDRVFRQTMNKTAAKSLVALRQKVKKYVRIYATDISAAREASLTLVDSSAENMPEKKEDEESDDNDVKDSSEWDDSDESNISDSEQGSVQCIREYFLKKSEPAGDLSAKPEKKRVRKVQSVKRNEEKGWKTISSLGFTVDFHQFLKEEISVSTVSKILTVLTGSKHKRHSSNRHKIKLLNELLALTEANNLGLPLIIKVRLALAAAAFDSNLNHTGAMKSDNWDLALSCMSDLAKSLQDVDFDIDPHIEEEELETAPFVVRGSIVSLVERLDEEFLKMLKDCDPYGDDYIIRLKDETVITSIVEHVLKFIHLRGSDASARCRINLCKIGHLYYKLDKSIFDGQDSTLSEIDRLCKFVYNNDSTHVLRTRAILAQIYHFALHNRWIEARDLMLMSHLQESIQHSDCRTQILYNRAMTQLGLCAFRIGRFKEAHQCLADLMSSGRAKELLGQGFLPFRIAERTREQEIRERQLQMPYHLHIPVELVEFVYLVSAMIVDVPYLVTYTTDLRRRIISKPLYQLLRMIEKQCLTGPPDNVREHIAAACRALRAGQWQSCYNFLINPKMDVKVWSKIQQPAPVQKILEKTIKGAALLTHVLSFAAVYDSLNIDHMAEMFALEVAEVRQQLASIITEGDLRAALDEPTGTLVPQQSRCSLLHCLATQLVERLSLLLETNERYCRFGPKSGFVELRAPIF